MSFPAAIPSHRRTPRPTRAAVLAGLILAAAGASLLQGCTLTRTNRQHLEHRTVVLEPGEGFRAEALTLN